MKLRYACIVLVIVAGSARSQTGAAGPRKFEVATVKPSNSSDTRPLFNMSTILSGGQFTAKNATVRRLIEIAYGTKSFQISGGPGWIGSELFDIAAKPDGQSTVAEFRSMLQSLLSERFGLIMGRETKEMPVYALVVRTTGSKLTEANGSGPNITRIRRGLIAARGITAPGLCDTLSGIVGGTVIDKTYLKANIRSHAWNGLPTKTRSGHAGRNGSAGCGKPRVIRQRGTPSDRPLYCFTGSTWPPALQSPEGVSRVVDNRADRATGRELAFRRDRLRSVAQNDPLCNTNLAIPGDGDSP